jgi:hypothetical protein
MKKNNIIKWLVITTALLLSVGQLSGKTHSIDGNTYDYSKLTLYQKLNLDEAYNYGKSFGIGYEMATVRWKETFVGERIIEINLQDPSIGPWHKNVYWAVEEHKEMFSKNNDMTRNLMAQHMINNLDFMAGMFIDDFEWLLVAKKGNLRDAYASYPGIADYKTEKARNYASCNMAARKELILHAKFEERLGPQSPPKNTYK